MTTLRSLGAASLLALISSHSAFGAAYVGSAYDGFAYTAGNMTTLNGGTGWNATGDSLQPNTTTWGISQAPNGTVLATNTPFNLAATAANQLITGASLDFTGPGYLAETGASLLITGAGQVGRNFAQTVDSGFFYFSYLTRKTIDQVRTVNFTFFGDNGATAAPQERLAIGQIANNANLRLPSGLVDPDALIKANQGQIAVLINNAQAGNTALGGVYTAVSPRFYAVDQTLLIVGKIEFNRTSDGTVTGTPTAFDRLTLYVNPDSLATEPLTSYLVLDGANLGSLVGFRMFAGATQTNQTVGATTGLTFPSSAAMFDEIRFGTTFADVTTGVTVPPPSPLQEWLDLNFTASEQLDPAVGTLDADPDRDGRVNLIEYALDSAPLTADVASSLVSHSENGVFALDYPRLRSDLTYEVETSTDLVAWTTAGVTTALTGGAAPAHMHTASVPLPGGGRVFLRLRVTQLE